MNRLRQMEIFAHIVEQGSISAAAEQLELSKSVISQHLKSLEQELGLTLLKRTTRRQTLTEAGASFYTRCKNLSEIANQAWQQLEPHKTQPQGKIKLTASHALMDSLVVPAIAKLMQSYPELSPELISEDQHLDFMEHNIDLAIRVGTSKDSNYRQKRLGVFRDVLCASAPIPADKNLEEMPYIANSWQGKNIVHQFQSKQGKKFNFQVKPKCIANSFHSCLSLIQSGAGIGLIPSFYFAKGELIDLLPEMKQAENPIYAVHPYSNQPLNVKVCITAIEQELTQHQYLTN